MTLISPQSATLIKPDAPVVSLSLRDVPPVALVLGNQPINTIAPVISGIAQRGETLTSTTGTWTGVGTITFAYQWQRDEVNISGATSSTYVLVADDDNTSITCVVSATDSEGTGTATSNAISPILGVPYNLVAPVASGTGQVGQTLSTTNGSWQGIATITFTYQWRRDASDISGATSSTYTLVGDDYATDIDCVVTATNSLGSANQDSNDIANIAGSVPVISGVPTISGTPKVGEILTATAASVTGTPTPTDTFQWQRSDDGSTGWANVSGATSTTYTAVSADEGKFLRVVQTSTNEAGSDTANSASTTQVQPSFTGILDTYSGASVAYSLRLLRSEYSGSAIRVRRSDDNTEQDIGFRNNDLDTSALETFSIGSDCFVVTWYDQSGNSHNATTSVASEQPKIVSSGTTITQNGKPCVDFDGNNNGYELSDQDLITSLTDGTQTAISVHSVDDVTGSTDNIIYSVSDRNGVYHLFGLTYRSNEARAGYYNGSSWSAKDISASNNTQYLGFNVVVSGEPDFYQNNSQAVSGSNPSVDGNQGLSIGKGTNNNRDLFGTIQELIFYANDQTNNRSGMQTNINDHYSIY